MKLNPTKCAFGVSAGRFLGFMMIQRGIEANPAQLQAILEPPAPNSKKGIQQLTGRLAALRLFISRSINCLKPYLQPSRKRIEPDGMKSAIGLSPTSNSTWKGHQFLLVGALVRHFLYSWQS